MSADPKEQNNNNFPEMAYLLLSIIEKQLSCFYMSKTIHLSFFPMVYLSQFIYQQNPAYAFLQILACVYR